ncbi:Ig-like domain-containing protein, partial [Bacteroidota bacterium]
MTRTINYFVNVILIFLIFSSIVLPQNYNYISPKDGSKYNSLSTNIILNPGNYIDITSLSETMISVIGSKSGYHEGELILSDDGKTILFNPLNQFLPNEKVMVKVNQAFRDISGKNINPISFEFTTTSLSKPIVEQDESFVKPTK